MPSDDYSELLSAIENVLTIPEVYRPRMSSGDPGGLLDFRDIGKPVYVLGDLHGNVNNLKASLETDQLSEKLEADEAILLLLGDLVHEDRVGYLTEWQSSLEMLDYIIELINLFPNNLFILRGNHDSFDPQLSKSGIRQGMMFAEYLETNRGEEYLSLVGRFFDTLPLFFMGDRLLAVHAGPIRGGVTREHLIEILRYEEEMFQLTWNRINLIGSVPNRKEYGETDISVTKELLGYPEDSYFIVGHNPLLERGGDDSIWFDVMGIRNYIITYDALPTSCPILLFKPGAESHLLLYADLKIKKPRFILGDY